MKAPSTPTTPQPPSSWAPDGKGRAPSFTSSKSLNSVIPTPLKIPSTLTFDPTGPHAPVTPASPRTTKLREAAARADAARIAEVKVSDDEGAKGKGASPLLFWEQNILEKGTDHTTAMSSSLGGPGSASNRAEAMVRLVGNGESNPMCPYFERAYRLTDKWRRVDEHASIMTQMPESYVMSTDEEKKVLKTLLSFSASHHDGGSDGTGLGNPLLLCPRNECGVRKFVCSTVTPTRPGDLSISDREGEIVKFVQTCLSYEPLPFPTCMPVVLPSPATVMETQVADSFDYAMMLVSLLVGAGHQAFVVSGTAPEDIAKMSTADTPAAEADSGSDRIDGLPSVVNSAVSSIGAVLSEEDGSRGIAGGYGQATPVEIAGISADCDDGGVSEYLAAGLEKVLSNASRFDSKDESSSRRIAHAADSARHMAKREERNADGGRGRKADMTRSLVHAWVLVMPSPTSDHAAPVFIDPPSARVFRLADSPFYQVRSVWNHENYFVNMQGAWLDSSDLSYDFNDKVQWMSLFVTKNDKYVAHPTLSSLTAMPPPDPAFSAHPSFGQSSDTLPLIPLCKVKSISMRSDFTDRTEASQFTVIFSEGVKRDAIGSNSRWGLPVTLPMYHELSDFRAHKVLRYADCTFECFPNLARDDGLVCRRTHHKKGESISAVPTVAEDVNSVSEDDEVAAVLATVSCNENRVTERYVARLDKLHTRSITFGGQRRIVEEFSDGREDRLKQHVFVDGVSRELVFFPGSHIHTGLVRRWLLFDKSVVEVFEQRHDLMVQRVISLRSKSLDDVVQAMFLHLKYGPLPPSKNPSARARVRELFQRVRWASRFVRRGVVSNIYGTGKQAASLIGFKEFFSRPDKPSDNDMKSVEYDTVLNTITVTFHPLPGSLSMFRTLVFDSKGGMQWVGSTAGGAAGGTNGCDAEQRRLALSQARVPAEEDAANSLAGTMKPSIMYKELCQRREKSLEEMSAIVAVCGKTVRFRAREENEKKKTEEQMTSEMARATAAFRAAAKYKGLQLVEAWNADRYKAFGLQMEYGYRWLQKMEERRRRIRLSKAAETAGLMARGGFRRAAATATPTAHQGAVGGAGGRIGTPQHNGGGNKAVARRGTDGGGGKASKVAGRAPPAMKGTAGERTLSPRTQQLHRGRGGGKDVVTAGRHRGTI